MTQKERATGPLSGALTPKASAADPVAQLLNRAYIASGLWHDPGAAVSAAQQAINAAGRARDYRSQAIATALLSSSLVDLDRHEEALRALKQRHSALLSAGSKGLADVERKLGLLLYGKANNAQHGTLLRAELEAAARRDDAESVTVIASALAVALWEAGEVQEAADLARFTAEAAQRLEDQAQRASMIALSGVFLTALRNDDSLTEAGQLLDHVLDGYPGNGLPVSYAASALRARAQIHGRLGAPDQGLPYARARADLCLQAKAYREAFDALLLAAALSSEAGDDAAAAQSARAALDLVQNSDLLEPAGSSDQSIPPLREAMAIFNLGQYQLWSGDPETALTTFQQAGAAAEKHDAPTAAQADILVWAGRAAQSLQDHGLARRYWEAALAVIEASAVPVPPEARAAAAVDLAQSYLFTLMALPPESTERPRQLREALSKAEQGVEAARASGSLRLLIQALDVSARARTEAGDEQGLDQAQEAFALAERYGSDWLVADVRDSCGRALMALGRVAEAAPILLTAAAEYAAAGDPMSAAMAELVAGRGFAAEERPEEAFGAYGSCLSRLPQDSEQYRGVALEYAHVLETYEHREAGAALRAALA
ncbi:hypothetical protein [Acaricomes phytoseiuli]|uniref:hypothetical protein n=1 Tax=Acaricomes phytoseiuli TaxID=291968 RepID=UPI00036D897C|nr:hypothetical protein [Acaricomes phytoseiuli]